MWFWHCTVFEGESCLPGRNAKSASLLRFMECTEGNCSNSSSCFVFRLFSVCLFVLTTGWGALGIYVVHGHLVNQGRGQEPSVCLTRCGSPPQHPYWEQEGCSCPVGLGQVVRCLLGGHLSQMGLTFLLTWMSGESHSSLFFKWLFIYWSLF